MFIDLSRFVAYGMGRLHRQDAPCATSHTLHRYATWYVAAFPDQHAVWSAPMFLAPRRAVPGATREHHETTPPGVALLVPLPDLITVIPVLVHDVFAYDDNAVETCQFLGGGLGIQRGLIHSFYAMPCRLPNTF